jgi:predicted dehydrogenase
MENGACIYLEASWAINMLESREASTTLCGTKAGAEIHSGMSYPKEELIYNRGHHGMLTEERNSPGGAIAYFTGGASEPGYLEARQWLEAIRNNTQPLVNPEQAYQVTRILEAVYQSHEQGKEILL